MRGDAAVGVDQDLAVLCVVKSVLWLSFCSSLLLYCLAFKLVVKPCKKLFNCTIIMQNLIIDSGSHEL